MANPVRISEMSREQLARFNEFVSSDEFQNIFLPAIYEEMNAYINAVINSDKDAERYRGYIKAFSFILNAKEYSSARLNDLIAEEERSK